MSVEWRPPAGRLPAEWTISGENLVILDNGNVLDLERLRFAIAGDLEVLATAHCPEESNLEKFSEP